MLLTPDPHTGGDEKRGDMRMYTWTGDTWNGDTWTGDTWNGDTYTYEWTYDWPYERRTRDE